MKFPAQVNFLANNFLFSFSSMVKIQDRLDKAAKCLQYFATQQWSFEDDNVRTLNLTLSDQDRSEFSFDVAKINWDEYIENYVLGIRRWHNSKPPPTTTISLSVSSTFSDLYSRKTCPRCQKRENKSRVSIGRTVVCKLSPWC